VAGRGASPALAGEWRKTCSPIVIPFPDPVRRGTARGFNLQLMSARHKTVLVVDDEDSARRFIRAALRPAHYTLLEATSYDQALSMFERHLGEIDLLLVDVSMPGKNGLELARALLAITPDLEVLYMSGRAGAAGCEFYGVPQRGEHFLQKPFRHGELVRKVGDLIGPAEPLAGAVSQ
jgi:CheY-like chemotaxis protein